MIPITRAQLEMLRGWFVPEEPGPAIGPHVLYSGCGWAWVDRWPAPRALVVESPDHIRLYGEPTGLEPHKLAAVAVGLISAPPAFERVLTAAVPRLERWPRTVYVLPEEARLGETQAPHPVVLLRRLTAADGWDVETLSPESVWISKSWGGGVELARGGYGWGAWVDGALAAVACTFARGEQYEDVGVVTEPDYAGRGLGRACAGALCADIRARGRIPTWTTSPANRASVAAARALGFAHHHDDVHYVPIF